MKQLLAAIAADENLLKALEGTLIQEILGTMQAGLAGTCPKPIAEGEKVIGELSAFEQALNYLCDKCGETESGLVDRFRGEVGEPPVGEEDVALTRELKACREKFKILLPLMWGSVNTRLAEHDEAESIGMAFREGGQIVLVYDEPKPNMSRGYVVLGGGHSLMAMAMASMAGCCPGCEGE